MVRVLFVCLGNICRSPMAEAVFSHLVIEAGLEDKIEADSAGTGHWHVGDPAHPGTLRMLAKQGIEYRGRARVFHPEDLNRFDYIVTMDNQNLRDVKAFGEAQAKVAPLMDYAPEVKAREVPDPYYNGKYQEVYDLVSVACARLLETICREHDLA
jgi:protein-tyrosine phosphatase